MSDISSPELSVSSGRRRPETLWSVLRSFSRLWGFLAFLVFVIFLFRGVALPFVFGLLVAYLLGPVVARMQPHIGRVAAVIVCYVVLLSLLGLFAGLLLPAVAQDFALLRDTAPAALERFNEEWLPKAEAWVEEGFGPFFDGAKHVAPAAAPPMTSELFIEPMADGTLRINLESVRLAAHQQDDGSWILGLPEVEKPRSTDFSGALRDFMTAEAHRLGAVLGPAVQAVISFVANFFTNFVLTFMIGAFVLVDMSRVNGFVRSLIPTEYRHDFEELWKSMDRGLSGVIRGQLLICLVNGTLTLVGLLIFNVKYSFLLALFAGALSLIPIFGTIVSSIPIIIIALVSDPGNSAGPALGMLAWISGIHLLEANVFNPKIIGDSAHIHPVIVIFALLAGEHVFGLVGALLAIPATSIIQAIYMHARRRSSVFSRDPDLP